MAAVCAAPALLLLVGCAEQGALYKANVYSAPNINQSQITKAVQISSVIPAKIELDKALVDGVQITYTLDRVTATSVQVGRACEFKIGAGLLISTAAYDTRLQPNSTCGANPIR